MLPPLEAGDLRHRIIISRGTRIRKPGGGYETQFWPIATCWAEVQGQNGREAVIGQALQGVSFYRIRIRHRDGILQSDQIKVGALTLNISSASDPNGDREQLLILADTGSVQKQ